MLALDCIDPAQPRKEFDAQSLRELADTIALRGVRQPISVRPHPENAERWILKFGARRLRAPKLAGKSEIPAFVDATSDSYDQVIENEQRESLKPIELALFVQRQMAAGDSQAEIARRLGKSRQYITYATALIEAPDWLLAAYREGKCRGLTELYELRKLFNEYGAAVQVWVADREAITRENLAAMLSELKRTETVSEPVTLNPMAELLNEMLPESAQAKGKNESLGTASSADEPLDLKASSTAKATRLVVELRGREFELVVDKDPGQPGEVIVKPLRSGAHKCVPAADLTLIGFVGVDQMNSASG